MNVLGIIANTGRVLSEEVVVDTDGNVTTHSWFLPETAEIIWGGLASLIIFYALYKFGWPQMKKSFEARTARIQKELDDAAAAVVVELEVGRPHQSYRCIHHVVIAEGHFV